MSRLTALIREDREYKNFASAFTEAIRIRIRLPPIRVISAPATASKAKLHTESPSLSAL